MKHVTQAEFAKLRGVNKSTVTRWIQNGRMATEPNGLIDPDRAAAQLDATESSLPHHQARKAQFDEARQGVWQAQPEKIAPAALQPSATGIATDGRSIKEQIEAERLRKERAQADAMEMERDKARKALIDLAYHQYAVREQAEIVRALIESMPHRLAPGLSACRGDVPSIVAELESFAHEFMTEVSHGITRRAKEIGF